MLLGAVGAVVRVLLSSGCGVRRPLSMRLMSEREGAFCAAVMRPGMNWIEVLAIPPATKSAVPVTAALMAWMDVLSRGVVAMMKTGI